MTCCCKRRSKFVHVLLFSCQFTIMASTLISALLICGTETRHHLKLFPDSTTLLGIYRDLHLNKPVHDVLSVEAKVLQLTTAWTSLDENLYDHIPIAELISIEYRVFRFTCKNPTPTSSATIHDAVEARSSSASSKDAFSIMMGAAAAGRQLKRSLPPKRV